MAELFNNSLFSDANLQAYYRLEGNSSDSKDGNVGADANMTYSTAAGKFGQGAIFNGSNGRINTQFNLSAYTNGTWTFWFKTSTSQDAYLGGGNDGSGHYIRFHQDSSDKLVFQMDNGSGSWSLVTATTINDGAYHMATGTWGSTGAFLYIDGVQIATDVSTAAPNCTAATYLGALNNNGSGLGFWAGNQDDVAFFNRQLTLAQITSLYASGGGLLLSEI